MQKAHKKRPQQRKCDRREGTVNIFHFSILKHSLIAKPKGINIGTSIAKDISIAPFIFWGLLSALIDNKKGSDISTAKSKKKRDAKSSSLFSELNFTFMVIYVL